MLLRLTALSCLALAACPAPADECKLAGAIDAELVAADSNGALVTIHDGDPVALMGAPQGGHILLVGARIHTDAACQVDATGSLRDPATNRVLGLDERALFVERTGDGWAAPSEPVSLSAMPNVAVCPTAATAAAVNGNTYQLEVAITGGSGSATLTAMVVPTCPAGDSYCTSDCGAPTL